MAQRRWLIGIIALAAILDAAAIARTLVPAQDGLKFLAVARRFQRDPWADVIRGTDQHPLYPALVALAEPAVASVMGRGPEAWRVAAQGVSAVASLLMLLPLHGLARELFGDRVAAISVILYVLLPLPAEVGRDTLANAVGLAGMIFTLWLGSQALRRDSWRYALASGLVGGLAFAARPEAVLAPLAVGVAMLIRAVMTRRLPSVALSPMAPALALSLLASIGAYALAKGQVSEKLALRQAAGLGAAANVQRSVPQPLPRGLEGAGLDLSPKEEGDQEPMRGALTVLRSAGRRWWDAMCWGFAIMAVWGLLRRKAVQQACGLEPSAGDAERLVMGAFAAAYLAALVIHGTKLGYLSGRHVLPLVAIASIYSAGGIFVCLHRLGPRTPISGTNYRRVVGFATAVVAAGLIGYQLRPGHESRRGHWLAGRWLIENAGRDERVLDTRGWARFVADRPDDYDYWHVRQALSDRSLAYVIVGRDELEAGSPRARSLNAILAYAASPAREFPVVVDGRDVGARIFRMHRDVDWEGFTP